MISNEQHTKAMDKVRLLVNVRERSVLEIEKRLQKDGFTHEEIKDAIDTSLRCNLISNERFASAYIRGKVRLGWGKEKICSSLKQKGITDSEISKCEDDFLPDEEEYEKALEILQKRPSNSKNKLASYINRLVNKGYSFELANRAARDFIAHEA